LGEQQAALIGNAVSGFSGWAIGQLQFRLIELEVTLGNHVIESLFAGGVASGAHATSGIDHSEKASGQSIHNGLLSI
jgi:hypothetical protein